MIDTKLENAIQKLDDTFTKQKSIANKYQRMFFLKDSTRKVYHLRQDFRDIIGEELGIRN